MASAPTFLRALDNTCDAGDGTFVADCPICRDLLLVRPDADGYRWRIVCDGGCEHEEIVRWLRITDLRTEAAAAWGARAWVALMLATTPDIWAGLLLGEPVNEAALDQAYLARFRKAGIIP